MIRRIYLNPSEHSQGVAIGTARQGGNERNGLRPHGYADARQHILGAHGEIAFARFCCHNGLEIDQYPEGYIEQPTNTPDFIIKGKEVGVTISGKKYELGKKPALYSVAKIRGYGPRPTKIIVWGRQVTTRKEDEDTTTAIEFLGWNRLWEIQELGIQTRVYNNDVYELPITKFNPMEKFPEALDEVL